MALCGDAARILIYDPRNPEDMTDPDAGLPACFNHALILLESVSQASETPFITVKVLPRMTRTERGSLTAVSRKQRIPCQHRQNETSMNRRWGYRGTQDLPPDSEYRAEPTDTDRPGAFPTETG